MEPKRDTGEHPKLADDASDPSPDAEAIPTERRENGTAAPQPNRRDNAPPAADHLRRPTWFEKLSFLFEGTVAIGTLGALVFLWFQSDQMERALKQAELATIAAQRQTEITDRPWLKASVVLNGPNPLYSNIDNLGVQVAVLVENIGNSVANPAMVSVQAVNVPWGNEVFRSPQRHQKAMCDEVRNKGKTNDAYPHFMLFPGEKDARFSSHGFGRSEAYGIARQNRKDLLRSNPNAAAAFPQHPVNLYIVGCVTYWYDTSPVAHQTGFIYDLSRRSKDNPNLPAVIDLDTMATTPAETFLLTRFFFGGFYAD